MDSATAMLKNYFKIAWRNVTKNKVYSFINIKRIFTISAHQYGHCLSHRMVGRKSLAECVCLPYHPWLGGICPGWPCGDTDRARNCGFPGDKSSAV